MRRTNALRVVSAVAGAATDRELITRFAAGDEASFAVLVRRHGGLVLGVCRRVLPCVQDAEDATQAVFMVLAKKAARGRWQESVANWLYTTARRVALKASRANARRSKREAKANVPSAQVPALDQMTGREAFAALDEELDRLPTIYREPLILCCLQGLTRDEAAERLKVPPVTLKSHLDRGRKRLAAALERRGVVAGAALLAVVATSTADACSHRLTESVLAAVGGSPSPAAAALAQGVAVNTWMKPTLFGVITVTAMSLGLLGFSPPTAASADEKPAMKAEKPGAKKDEKAEKPTSVGGTVVDPDGKPVAGATVYLGYGNHDERAAAVKVAATDADGRFKADVPKDTPPYFWVLATKPGFGVAWEEPKYPTPVLANADKLTLKLTKDQPIRGKVVDTEGKPVAGAQIGVYDVIEPTNAALDPLLKGAANGGFGLVGQWEKVLWIPRSVAGTTTDKDGRFELAGMGADRVVSLTVSGKGLARMSAFVVTRTGVDVDPLNQQSKGMRRTDKGRHPVFYGPSPALVVEPGYAVEGTVTDKKTGKPIAGCTLQINTGYWDRLHATTDKDGKYHFDGMTKGMGHYVSVSPPKGLNVFPTWGDVKEGIGYQTVTHDVALVSGAVFAGKVIDKETRQPVSASFQIIPTGDNKFAKLPEYETATRDMVWKGGGTDGKFRIVTLPGPSKVEISVLPTGTLHGAPFHPYRAGQTLEIDLPTEGEKEHLIEIDRGGTAAASAVDEAGRPVTGVAVSGITNTNQDGVEQLRVFVLPADEAKFTVYGLGDKETRRVVAIHPEKKLGGSRLVTGKSEGAFTLHPLQPLRGTFTDVDGHPLAGVVVTIDYDGYGTSQLFREHAPKWKMSATTDKDGKFEIPDVVPGVPFTFGVHKGDTQYRGVPRLGSKTVPAGKPLDLGVRKLEEIQE